MKNILVAFMLIVALFSVSGSAQSTEKISVNIQTPTFIEFDRNINQNKYLVNLSVSKLGRVTYIEEYFTVDSNSNPKHQLSKIHYDQNIITNNVSFYILRPPSRGGKMYNMIRAAVLFNGVRVKEKWVKRSSGAHLTYTIDQGDAIQKINENIDKFETRSQKMIANDTTTFTYTIPEISIYEINVTSRQNEADAWLKVTLLKGFPYLTKKFPGLVYKYLDITFDYKIKKMSIRYKVENSWINNSNMTDKNVMTFNWNSTDKKWHDLKTNITSKDGNYTYFETEITKVTPIVITAMDLKKKKNNSTINTPTPTPTPTNAIQIETTTPDEYLSEEDLAKEMPDTPESPEVTETENIFNKKVPGFGFIIGTLALATVYILRREIRIDR